MTNAVSRRLLIAGAVVLVLVGVIVGPRVVSGLTKRSADPQLATASFRSFPVVATATGSVVPASQVALSFGTVGQLKEVDVAVGDKVTAGQVLARIDDSVQQAGLALANSSLGSAQAALASANSPLSPSRRQLLENAVTSAQGLLSAAQKAQSTDTAVLSSDQSRYNTDGCNASPQPDPSKCNSDQGAINADQNRLQQDSFDASSAQLQLANAQANLAAQGIADPAAVASAQAQVTAAQAGVARAQAALAQTVLVAPVSGTVLAINAQVGELVGGGSSATSALGSGPLQPGDTSGTTAATSKAFAVIGDSTGLQVAAPFAESDVARLSAGESGTFTVDAIPGLTLPCHLISLAQGSTVSSGVVQYFGSIGFDAADPRLRPGMTVNVSIVVARADNVLAVPNQALYALDGSLHVDVWYQGRSVSTPVTTGLVGAELTQVTTGLQNGQQVVLSAPHGLPSPSPTG